MQRQVVKIYAILIAFLAICGLFIQRGHLFGLMNADLALDLLRVVVAIILLYVGFRSTDPEAIRGSLIFVGLLYIGLALIGLINSTAGGLLPNGLTGFDVIFHLVTGILALAAGSRRMAARTS